MQMPMRGDSIFTAEEKTHLATVLEPLGDTIHSRELMKKDPAFCDRVFRVWKCARWTKGIGVRVKGPGFSPAVILAEMEESR